MTDASNPTTSLITPGDSVKVAILSDLHAHDESRPDARPSHLKIDTPENLTGEHPVMALIDLITTKSLTADLLLCGGDLGDKAKPIPLQYAWRAVHRIKEALGATRLAATAGNHDVDSRHAYNHYDARGQLQSLTPRFPIDDEILFDRYWSRHFVILIEDHYRLVLLNSSAYHGAAAAANERPEYEQGRVSPHTLAALRMALMTTAHRTVNILLCHHHPIPHEELNLGSDDIMKGGGDLMTLLSSGDFGQWLVVHGHKHHPKITYASSTTSTRPIVFAAGSLCSSLFLELQTTARNQFYIVEFPLAECESRGLVGQFSAWDWISAKGWQPSQDGSGLPHIGGFGFQRPANLMASDIAKRFPTQPQVSWTDVLHTYPEISYYSPPDHRRLLICLEQDHRLRALSNGGQVVQLDRLS